MSDRPAIDTADARERTRAPDLYEVSEIVTVREAAAALGVSEPAVRRAIRQGELVASRHGRSFRITRTALEHFRARRDAPAQSRRLRLVAPLPAGADPAPAAPTLIPLISGDTVGRVALPSPLTAFVGRAREVAALDALLRGDGVRLVTLTGPGGVGKTRLALEAAGRAAPDLADGAAFVGLASIRDPSLVASAIAQALGLRESDVQPASARIVSTLRDRQSLLILDNFEHVMGPATGALIVTLLTSCPGLKMLITSRALLHVSGEHAFTVPPLALPDTDKHRTDRPERPPLDELERVEAVQLFVDRARAAWSEFALTEENCQAVAAVCERVDGLPLAIELAAARSAVLSPATMLTRLQQRLPLLAGGPRDQPSRLRTMRDAIAWSYELLDPVAQARFRRLAVFSGGITLAAAEAVVDLHADRTDAGVDPTGAERGGPISSLDQPEPVLDSLEGLLTGSLLQRTDRANGESRLALLETVREFALERLIDAGEERAARRAHAAHFLDVIEQAQPELWGSTNERVLDRIEVEHDNMRAALTWSLEHEPPLALRLAGGLGQFWSKRSHWTEGRGWLERAMQRNAGADTVHFALALGRTGAIAGDQGDSDEARAYLQESLTLGEQLGDALIAARSLRGLGIIASNQSEFPQAARCFAQALARFRLLDDQPGVARCLNDLGLVAGRQGDHQRAIAYQEEALPISRKLGDDWQVCIVLGNLGGAYYDRGEYERGEALSEESLAIARRIGDTFGVAVNLHNLGNCVVRLGDTATAVEHYREALSLSHELGEHHLASRTLDRLGIALHLTGASRPAARLFGAADGLREATGDTLFAEEDVDLLNGHHTVRDALGEATYVASWESGRTLPFEQAMAEAVAAAGSALVALRAAPVPALAGLTAREIEVLRLLADGRSDKDIAAALFVSRPTASKHVAAIISKLGVESRTAAVALALRHGVA